ncbi:MAG: oligosaccharide flippase family protein [Deltaproteobacteria bacterium]|nr:oligosaccharide flippase family protein [Deltaproteobacteria bacterium]
MILKNTMVGWASRLLNFLVAMVSTPLLVHYLGEASFGIWLLLMNLWNFLSLLDLGLYQAFVRRAADDLAAEDQEGLAATVRTGLSLYLLVSLLTLGLYALVIPCLGCLFNIPAELLTTVQWAAVPLAVVSALYFPSRIYEGLLFARERILVFDSVGMFLGTLRLGLLWLALAGGWGLWGVALVFSLTTLGEYLIVTLLCRRHMGRAATFQAGWDRGRVRMMVSYAAGAMLNIIGLKARRQAPSLMLGALADPVALARFGVSMRLLTYSSDLVTAGSLAVQPRFSLLEAQARGEELSRLLIRANLYTGFLAGWLGVGLWFLAEPFIGLWLGPDFNLSGQMVRLMVLPLCLSMALGPCEAILYSLKRQRFTGWLSLAEVALLAGLALMLIPRWGAMGAAVSLGVCLVLLRPWLLTLYVCRSLGLGWGRFWVKGPGRAALSLAVACLPLAWLFRAWRVTGWVELMAAGVVVSLACGLAFALLGLGWEERRFWREKLTGFMARRSRGA